jgi:hypothetical protein
MSSAHLPQADLSSIRLLVVPDMSGMKAEEMRCLTEFARRGGKLLLTGRATLYDENGEQLPDFALAKELGLRFVRLNSPEPGPNDAHKHAAAEDERLAVEPLPAWTGPALPSDLPPQPVVLTRPIDGETWVQCRCEKGMYPLVHVRPLGAGEIAYSAAPQALEITTAVIDRLLGAPPVTAHPPEKQAILTRQEPEKRWILHLMSDGQYAVEIRGEFARPTRVAAQYPAAGWTYSFGQTASGARVEVGGAAKDRLLVLE